MTSTGIIILAAGRSARFGQVKQLLPFNDQTFLQHIMDEAIAAGAAPIVVVTGAHAKEVTASIEDYKVDVVFNEQWEQGKGSGIVAGVQKTLELDPKIQQIIISVCDQPFVTASLFLQLYQTQKDSQKQLVASAYAETVGTPVLLTRKYFDQLLGLKKEAGARQLLMAHGDDVATVDFPKGAIDIDTKEDYERWRGF